MPSRDDRRCVLARPSSKGVELFRKIYPEGARCNRSLFEKAFKPEQVKELSAVFSRS
jgi:DNA-binding MarR family transcriptional regulator